MHKSIELTVVILALVCVPTAVLATVDSNDANQAIKQKPVAKTVEPIGWWKLNSVAVPATAKRPFNFAQGRPGKARYDRDNQRA